MAERVAKAKELLAAPAHGPDKPLKLEILYNTSENHKKIAIAIQDMWKQVGVDATLNNQEWQVYLDTRDNKAFDVARAAWIGDYADPITFLDLFLSDAGVRNDAGYNNAEFDKLVKDSFGDHRSEGPHGEPGEGRADLPRRSADHPDPALQDQAHGLEEGGGLGLQQPGLPSRPIHVDPVVGMS